VKVRTDIYERVHGRKPRGRSYWRFQLVTHRVTEKDHFKNSRVDQTYESALKEAQEVAARRKSDCIVVLP